MTSQVEQPFANLTVFDLTAADDIEALIKEFGSEIEWSSASKYLINEVIRGGVYSQCKGAILEREYVDLDFMRSYIHYFSHLFQEIPRFARRIHFFTRPMAEIDLQDMDSLKGSYIGVVVLRPSRVVGIVGRTFLPPPILPPDEYFHTLVNHDVHLCGATLSLQGTSYMEQDTQVAACATVAIWMSTSNLARSSRLPSLSTVEITQAATEYMAIERPLPSSGLTYYQMAEALRSMGYDPLNYEIKSWRTARRILYSYVESGIAPIILLNILNISRSLFIGHAITAIGHTYDRHTNPMSPDSQELTTDGNFHYFGAYQWAPRFWVNDDQQGPFQHLTHEPSSREWQDNLAQFKNVRPDLVAGEIDDLPLVKVGNIYALIDGIMVPNPPRVSLSSVEAEIKAMYVFRHLLSNLRSRGLVHQPERLVFRSMLMESWEYLERVSASDSLSDRVKHVYLGKSLPR